MNCINCEKHFSVGSRKKRYRSENDGLNFCSVECALDYYHLKDITKCMCGHAIGYRPYLYGGMLFCCQDCAFKYLGIKEIKKEKEQ